VAWCDGRGVLSWAGGDGDCAGDTKIGTFGVTSIFFDQSQTREGSAASAAPTNDWSQPLSKPRHMCELSPPTVPTIQPTLILLLVLLY
jgi:hypothetical protein